MPQQIQMYPRATTRLSMNSARSNRSSAVSGAAGGNSAVPAAALRVPVNASVAARVAWAGRGRSGKGVGTRVGVGGMTSLPAGGRVGVGVSGAGGAGNVPAGPGGGRVGTSSTGIVGDGTGVAGVVGVNVASGVGVSSIPVDVGVGVKVGEGIIEFGSSVLVGSDWKSHRASEGVLDPAIARVARTVMIVTSASNELSRERRLLSCNRKLR